MDINSFTKMFAKCANDNQVLVVDFTRTEKDLACPRCFKEYKLVEVEEEKGE